MSRKLVASNKPNELKALTLTDRFGNEVTLTLLDIKDPVDLVDTSSRVEIPPRPTYRAETYGGGYEEHEIDEEVIKQTPKDDPSYRDILRRYNEWIVKRDAANTKRNDILFRSCFYAAVRCTPPDADKWIPQLKRRHMIILPSDWKDFDETDRMVFYLENCLTVGQKSAIANALLSGQEVSEEGIQKIEEMFRSTVQEQIRGNPLLEADPGETTGKSVATQ